MEQRIWYHSVASKQGFARKDPYLFSILTAALLGVYLYATGKFSDVAYELSNSIALAYLDETLFRLLAAGAVVWFVRRYLPGFHFGLSTKGMGRGFSLLAVLYVMMLLGGQGRLLLADYSAFSVPSVWQVLLLPFFMLSVGLMEEFVFRGLILGLLYEKWGATRRGIAKAALASGLLFGVEHLLNLFAAPQMRVYTLVQAVGAGMIGVYFASVYLRCGSLWPLVAAHAMYDLMLLAPTMFFPNLAEAVATDIPLWQGALSLAVYSPFLIVGLVQLKKVWRYAPIQAVKTA